MYPPMRICLDPHCSEGHHGPQPQELLGLQGYRAVLFTHDFSPLPIWSYSAKCPCESSIMYPVSTVLTLTLFLQDAALTITLTTTFAMAPTRIILVSCMQFMSRCTCMSSVHYASASQIPWSVPSKYISF